LSEKPKPPKPERRRRDKAPKPARTKKGPRGEPRASLLSRWRGRSARIQAARDERALLAGYRRGVGSRTLGIGFLVALAVLALVWGFAFGISAPFYIMPLIAPLPVLALLIIWTLPQGEYAPTKALEPFYLAFLAALTLWPNYICVALPHLPWLTLLRLTGMPMVIILLIATSVSKGFRQHMHKTLLSDPIGWKMFLGFIVIQTLSIAFSSRLALASNKWIVFQTNCTAIFFVSVYVFTIPGFVERWARMLIGLCYCVCFMGLWESAIATLPWAEHIPSLLKVDGELIDSLLAGSARSALGVHRVQSTATTPLGLAELLGLAAPFALHMAMSRGPAYLRVAGAVYLPLALYLILLADSRLGIVALMGSVMAYALIWASLLWRRNRNSLLAPAMVLAYPVLLAMTVLATFAVGALRDKVWGGGAQQASTESRKIQWSLAWPRLFHAPWGHGIGEASRTIGFVSPNGRGTLDSYYITILMDFGILGFILFYGMFLRLAWTGGKAVVQLKPEGELTMLLPLAVSLINFVIIKSVFSQDANHPLVFMMLGASFALTYRAQLQARQVGYAPTTPSITRR